MSIYHHVYFSFQATTSEAEINQLIAAFTNLQSTGLIQHFSHGTNISPEGLNKGLTHGFAMVFSGIAERDQYLVHPDHVAFVDRLKPHLLDVMVFDFEC